MCLSFFSVRTRMKGGHHVRVLEKSFWVLFLSSRAVCFMASSEPCTRSSCTYDDRLQTRRAEDRQREEDGWRCQSPYRERLHSALLEDWQAEDMHRQTHTHVTAEGKRGRESPELLLFLSLFFFFFSVISSHIRAHIQILVSYLPYTWL